MGKFVEVCDDEEIPRTLTEWVHNFRMKKVQMKRKLRGAGSVLRVTAILSTALLHAEQKLRRKQQERFSRWIDIQAKFMPSYGGRSLVPHYNHNDMSDEDMDAAAEECRRQRIEEDNLWNGELSGLNDFMRSISSSCNQKQHQTQAHVNPTTITVKS